MVANVNSLFQKNGDSAFNNFGYINKVLSLIFIKTRFHALNNAVLSADSKEVLCVSNTKISIFLPDDHKVAQLPIKERAKTVKKMIEFSASYYEQTKEIKEDLREIKEILSKLQQSLCEGVYQLSDGPKPPKSLSQKRDEANNELVKNLLNI